MLSMNKILKSFAMVACALTLTSVAAKAQVIVVDAQRINSESSAYKDFNMQTGALQEDILKLQNYLRRGGGLEQEMAQIEKEKAISGADKYEEAKRQLQGKYQSAQRNLQIRQLRAEELYKEAQRQVVRARGPIITELLKQHNAQVMLYKGSVLGVTSGIDVTTQFIELLNEALPVVNLPQLEAAKAQPAQE